ncbi:LysR family transcriptional regulator [Pseudomonas panipatensis]|uniref:DNA-binding transcriptional regulator, LysR family n=1 Tax=Pseudomonas panipatensis TaxID=428992 RepID=A0A1G8MN87_9PSED|nr:LysR family transcriptional regulator [Pseudomonas panipatensis]SDI69421.1 DNA-binding transcriptional regulator, LysR family [Pseudomonas panipatensis]SMP77608.1 transcriptional regulator, LysR family [Pseudomonas panipatensis]
MSRLDEIITFVEVVNAGSITKAAERLGIVKSAVSRRLNDLEDRLKARLLVRSTAGLSITEAGRAFHERARHIIAELDEAELTVTDASANLFGTVHMSAPVSLTNLVLMPHISEFLRLNPGLMLDLSLSDRFVDIVNEGFDIAIRAGTLSDSRLVARKLVDMGRVTCASPEYLAAHGTPLTPQDLDHHDGLVSTNAPESVYWHYSGPAGETYLARPNTRMKVNNGEAVITAAVAGLGIAAVPAFISKELIVRGTLIPILSEYRLAAGSLYAIYPPGRHLSHRVRVLIDFLVERFTVANPE